MGKGRTVPELSAGDVGAPTSMLRKRGVVPNNSAKADSIVAAGLLYVC
jgi:hypothetical protein